MQAPVMSVLPSLSESHFWPCVHECWALAFGNDLNLNFEINKIIGLKYFHVPPKCLLKTLNEIIYTQCKGFRYFYETSQQKVVKNVCCSAFSVDQALSFGSAGYEGALTLEAM